MRKFKCSFDGSDVGLDSPETYKHLPDNTIELRDRMLRNIGYVLLYMDYLPDRKGLFPKRKKKEKLVKLSEIYPSTKNPDLKVDLNNSSYYQRQRVYGLIKEFAKNERQNYENIMWYKEMVFLFEDETENML